MKKPLLIIFAIFIIGFSMLEQQKKQFIGQLINLGESLVRIVNENTRDKLLGEEELALFQLVDDVTQNEQVLYVLIMDHKNIIKAHSSMEEVNKAYTAPEVIRYLNRGNEIVTGVMRHKGKEALFFETPIIYQKLKVGTLYLAISQEKVFKNICTENCFTAYQPLVFSNFFTFDIWCGCY